MGHFKKLISLMLSMFFLLTCLTPVFAAPVDEAVIDTTRSATLDIYKYDMTSAAKDGVWDSSYVSTGVRDTVGVEAILGNSARTSRLGNGDTANGYAIKGVEFTYLKIADIATFSQPESGKERVEVLYGIPVNDNTTKLLKAIGVSATDRYVPADQTVDGTGIQYFRSDVLVNSLATALNQNQTAVKSALESYIKTGGGTAMPETDAFGHTSAASLPLGLYLVVETKVPETVTTTVAPFLLSLPMTSVNGSNATDGGTRWLYDVTVYPKDQTGIPSLEKTVREAKDDTGHNNGSAAIDDGYAHAASASAADKMEYQILSTLPTITSSATNLSVFSFRDVLSKGLINNKDVKIEIFSDKECTDRLVEWNSGDSLPKFSATYTTESNGDSVMLVTMTARGLKEINSSTLVYGNTSLNQGLSDCTMRLSYTATVKNDDALTCGDEGNRNKVTLSWKRTSAAYIDTLVDDCHVYSYGLDLTKQFSDGRGEMNKVEFALFNETDSYYVQAALAGDGSYYVSGHTSVEAEAAHLVPTSAGKLLIKGLEDDSYVLTELRTANGYTLLKEPISIVIESIDSETMCDIYDEDALGLTQNDGRYTSEQKRLSHALRTASATVDNKAVIMGTDGTSEHALAPLTVINTRGFDLPQTGGYGNWAFPLIGCAILGLGAIGLLALKKKDHKD